MLRACACLLSFHPGARPSLPHVRSARLQQRQVRRNRPAELLVPRPRPVTLCGQMDRRIPPSRHPRTAFLAEASGCATPQVATHAILTGNECFQIPAAPDLIPDGPWEKLSDGNVCSAKGFKATGTLARHTLHNPEFTQRPEVGQPGARSRAWCPLQVATRACARPARRQILPWLSVTPMLWWEARSRPMSCALRLSSTARRLCPARRQPAL